MSMNGLTQELANELFEYRDGVLYWKNPPKTGGMHVGDKAGGLNGKGRQYVKVQGKKYATHRIIFLMHHGYLPNIVDHKDNNKTNNKIENLREATLSENAQNAKLRKTSVTGVKGVGLYNGRPNRFLARIYVNKREMVIGVFDNICDAKMAIEKARSELHGEFARHA